MSEKTQLFFYKKLLRLLLCAEQKKSMRIIAGKYRGRVIKSPVGNKTRPTSDRLRETLFNVINPRIDADSKFLDLCAGSGAVGIEAISRGVGFATFVDRSRKICGLIESNLDILEIPENQTEVFCNSADKFLLREDKKTWDLIYYDPPYNSDYYEVLNTIGTKGSETLMTDGLLLVEHHKKNKLPDLIGEIRRWRIIKQGETWLSFYDKN